MSENTTEIANVIRDALFKERGQGTLGGASLVAISIFLLTITGGVPEELHNWVIWPLYGLFVLGWIRIAWANTIGLIKSKKAELPEPKPAKKRITHV